MKYNERNGYPVKKSLLIAIYVVLTVSVGIRNSTVASSVSTLSTRNQSLETPSKDPILLSQQEPEKESKDEDFEFLMEEDAEEEAASSIE